MRRTRALSHLVVVGLLAGTLAAPALAVSSSYKAECRRLTRQIDHFEDVAGLAAERGDEMWFDGTVEHIRDLGQRRVRLCPEYEEPNYAAIYATWAKWMLRRAAEAFVTYATFGLY